MFYYVSLLHNGSIEFLSQAKQMRGQKLNVDGLLDRRRPVKRR